jgi:hypothetical protein
VTREEVEAAGHTIEALLARTSFGGGDWYTPGETALEKVANADVLKRLNPLTNIFIWASMDVGLRGISEENAQEFWLRMRMIEKVQGTYRTRPDPEDPEKRIGHPITLDEVRSHIGLTTNVSEMSWREWMIKQFDYTRERMLQAEGLEDDRGARWQPKLSATAEDTMDQVEAFQQALHRYRCGEDQAESRRHDKDYKWTAKALRYLGKACDAWDEIEDRLEDEEE